MSTIDSLLPEHLLQDAANSNAPKKNELGQNEFLKLMLAQLEHQDPFKPMENGEFVAQMAQFSTVAGIENMDKSLNGMNDAFAGNQLLQASSLIGRSALVSGSDATLSGESGIEAYYQLSNSASGVTIEVHNSAGALVHRAQEDTQTAGMHKIHWDGTLADGKRSPDGVYSLSVSHKQADQITQLPILIENKISSVALTAGSNAVTFETEEGKTVELQEIVKLQ